MRTPSRQLAREVAEVLSKPSRETSPSIEYTVHGVERGRHGDRRGINHIEHTTDPKQAYRFAKEMASKDYLVTVLAQDRQTGKYRAVMRGDRVNGKMKITVMDPAFPEGRSP